MEKEFEVIFRRQKAKNLRKRFSATRCWQSDHFWKFNPFLAFKVSIQHIFKKIKVTILEKLKMEKAPFSIFNPIFWLLGGVKT